MMNDPKNDLNMRRSSLALRKDRQGQPQPPGGVRDSRARRYRGVGLSRGVGGLRRERSRWAAGGGAKGDATSTASLPSPREDSPLGSSGIARVVAGMADPDQDAGGGFAMMRRRGEVTQGVLEDRCRH